MLLLIPIVALHRSGHMAMRREQEALRDPLTGLANRTMLATVTSRALQSRDGLSAMLLLDLDHFKDINDTLGHAVGDDDAGRRRRAAHPARGPTTWSPGSVATSSPCWCAASDAEAVAGARRAAVRRDPAAGRRSRGSP